MVSSTEKFFLDKCLNQFTEDVQDLYLPAGGEIAELPREPTALQFSRDWCSQNRPFVVRGAATRWQACRRWCPDYFRENFGSKSVSVAVTPDGFADAITADRYFALPEERQMSFSHFLDIMERPDQQSGIHYIQKQNSNLTEELAELLTDVPDHLTWVTEALGQRPDAVNFWMGDGRAVTSLHKDHYENVYVVVSGWKEFHLLPPTDRYRVPHATCPLARYRHSPDTDCFQLDPLPDLEPAPWPDLAPPSTDGSDSTGPESDRLHWFRIRLHAGDLLYLPSLWFHHVRQSHGCTAVNYWYDMQYDIKYCYFRLLESLAARH